MGRRARRRKDRGEFHYFIFKKFHYLVDVVSIGCCCCGGGGGVVGGGGSSGGGGGGLAERGGRIPGENDKNIIYKTKV